MFPPTRNSTLAQRTLAALRLTRSFLLLEDDYDVDWEVDQDEPGQSAHPHRVPLSGRVGGARHLASRRPGQPGARPQVCVSPVNRAAPARAERRCRPRHDASASQDDSRLTPGR
jgi:hypothetical protein